MLPTPSPTHSPPAGKVAIVTGASRGIGLGIAERLVANGVQVVMTARHEEALDQAVEVLGGRGIAMGIAGHADDDGHQDQVVAETLEAFGSIDFLVNNTGINPSYGPMVDLELSAARKTFEVNCLAAISWVQKVHRAWMGTHGGAIVNVSSVSAIRPAPNIGFYGATKAMLNSITELLAVELAPHVRVNGVAPSVVRTRFAAPLYEGRELDGEYPLGRLGEPEDVAGAVAFLLSPEASWITGQTLVLDGGSTLTTSRHGRG